MARSVETFVTPHAVRIGVDGYNLALPHGTGVATYARTLVETLRECGYAVDGVFGLGVPRRASNVLREILFFDRLDEVPGPTKASFRRSLQRALISPLSRHLVQTPVGSVVAAQSYTARLPAFDRLFSYGGLFNLAARHFRRYRRFLLIKTPSPVQVMHWTYPLPIRLAGARNIYTIHDLAPLRLPQASLEDKAYHYRLISTCLAKSDHVCTVSQASRLDMLDLFPQIEPDKITNTYQAVSPHAPTREMSKDDLDQRLRRLFDLTLEGYFLYFGALEPKKNIGRLLQAYLSAGLSTPLVIVGAGGWKISDELQLLAGGPHGGLPGSAGIRRLEYLPRELLMILTRGARAVLFPSVWEGFGLPVIEAMAMGAPVLTSNISALTEIAGSAALLVDPYDVAQIRAGIERLDNDAALRTELRAAGARNAARFSTEVYATRLHAMYDKVLAGAPARRGRSWPVSPPLASQVHPV